MLNFALWGIFILLLTLVIGASVHRTDGFLVEAFGSTCVDFIPFKTPSPKTKKPGTIFVSVASYRDPECSVTLQTMFENADQPERIFAGVCEQNKSGEDHEICMGPAVQKFANNIRTLTIDHKQAKGPTYARYYCADLWNGEEYFLQIDSHTTFMEHWDTDLINMINDIKNDPNESNYPVLSTYPPTEEQMKLKGFPEMDNGKMAGNGLPTFLCGWVTTDGSPQGPRKSNKPWAAAGFMFMESSALEDVPFDPNLSHLFQGEETLYSARLFTNGYDFYTPNKNVAFHHYSRDGPLYHEDVKDSHTCRAEAEKRVKFLLGIGDKKSVADDFARGLNVYGRINDFTGVIRALESSSDFKVLSRPTVYTANNRKAVISSGSSIAVPTNQFNSGTTGQSTNIEYRDVLLRFEVVPLINSDDEVTLRISLINDTVGEDQTIGDLTVPTIGTETITTTVTVKNNTTVVIGGLVTEVERNSKSGVPVLSRIPGIGRLFGRTRKSVERRELLVFIQPKIVGGTNSQYDVQEDMERRYEVAPAARSFADGLLPEKPVSREVAPEPKTPKKSIPSASKRPDLNYPTRR